MSFEQLPKADSKETIHMGNDMEWDVTVSESFMRKYGVRSLLSALALNAAVTTYPESQAEAAEITPGMSWQEGFSALKDDVHTASREQSALVVVLKDGTVYWTGSKVGESTTVEQTTDEALAPVQQELKNESVEVLCTVHTHPVRAFYGAGLLGRSTLSEQLVKQDATTLSAPPSGVDINPLNYYGQQMAVEASGGQFINVVFDPSNIWRYRVATEKDIKEYPDVWNQIQNDVNISEQWVEYLNSLVTNYSEAQLSEVVQLLPESEQKVVRFFGDSSDMKKDAIRRYLLQNSSSETTSIVLQNDSKGIELQTAVNEARQRASMNVKLWRDIRTEYTHSSEEGLVNDELQEELKKAYLRINVVLDSFSYDEIENNPLKLCAPEKSS